MTKRVIQRTQTGVRIETSLLKVLKGLAEYTNLSLGDLLEGIVLHGDAGGHRQTQIRLWLHADGGRQSPARRTRLGP